MILELKARGISVVQQAPIQINYRGQPIGDYFADLPGRKSGDCRIEGIQKLDPTHAAQVMNYLHGTGLKIGLLLNFGTPRVEVRRLVNNL